MKEILSKLSTYQEDALEKGIDFDLDLYFNSEHIPAAKVKMNYSISGDITKCYVFDTTFSDSSDHKNIQKKFSNIEHFITNVTEPKENK